MEIIHLDSPNNHYIDDLVVTIGQFDGVHLAHLALINKVKEIAKEKKLKSGLMTFDPHPDFILKKQVDETYITPIKEKIAFLNDQNLDYLFIVKFTTETASMLPKKYINNYLLSIGVKEAVVGFDFHYGSFGKGSAKTIEEDSDYQIKTTIIEEIKYENQKIGSALIRELLSEGNPRKVIEILGRPYQINAKVIKGMQVGSKIGIPTANLEIDESFVKVKPGVYAVKVDYHDHVYRGICNIGHNPSFNYRNLLSMEVHIIDFSGDLYGERISVSFIDYLRDEQQYPSINAFKQQIEKDLAITKEIVKI